MSEAIVRATSEGRFKAAALSLIAAKRSDNTRKAYRADLERWLSFCWAHDVDPMAAPLDAATAFREHLTVAHSKQTARRALAAMSTIYRVLLGSRLVSANPFHPGVLAWPTETMVNRTALVSAEVAAAMIAGARADARSGKGLRDAAILRLLYDTGLRRASVAAIRRQHFEPPIVRAIAKGDKEVEITLPEHTIEALLQWINVSPKSDFLFPGKDGARPIHPLTINKIVNERAEAVGAKGIHPHCFRAAFITAGYDAGLPEYEIQASVHHTDPKTTRRYDRGSRGKAVATQLAEFRKGRK